MFVSCYYSCVSMEMRNYETFRLQADFCRMLASPIRLAVISLLARQEMRVGDIAKAIGVPIAAVSQNLRGLKDREIVWSRKVGRSVFYRLADGRIAEASRTIRSVLLDRMEAKGQVARDLESGDLVQDG